MTEERTNTNVLMVEPGKAPYETQIGDDLQSMQAVVGGYIQAVYPYEEPVALICNEDGKLDGLLLNRALRDSHGDIYDIVAGNFFIVGLGQNDFTDLPHELAEQFAEGGDSLGAVVALYVGAPFFVKGIDGIRRIGIFDGKAVQ